MNRIWFRSVSAAIAITVTACSTSTPANRPGHTGRAVLNTTTAAELIGSFAKAGLAVPNAHDVTAVKCPEINCTEAMAADTVTVVKFGSTGAAQRFAGATPDMYQIEDIVLVFSPPVPADQRTAYEQIARTAV